MKHVALERLPDIRTGYPHPDCLALIIPLARTNELYNPSVELNTAGYAAVAGVIARSTTRQRYGAYSLAVTPTAALADGVYYLTDGTLTNGTSYAVSVDVWCPPGKRLGLYIATVGGIVLSGVKAIIGKGWWERVTLHYRETTATAQRRIYITQTTATTAVFYLDGLQLESLADGVLHATTYIDGDQVGLVPNQFPPAYTWAGTPHASPSTRSGQTRAGGYVLPFSRYGFTITALIGLGLGTVANVAQPYAQLDGSQYLRTRLPESQITVVGRFQATTKANLERQRRDLRQVVHRDRVSLDQPLRLVYTPMDEKGKPSGEAATLDVVYGGGLEGNNDNFFAEQAAIQFQLFLPYLTSGSEAASLTLSLSVTNANGVIKRSPAGVWSALATGLAGGLASAYAIAVHPNGEIYIGGSFTSAGAAGSDYITRYNPTTNTFASLQADNALNNVVNAIAIGPDGSVYVGGAFTNVMGVATSDYMARYDPSGNVWANITPGGAANSFVNALMFNDAGLLLAGGAFTSIDAVGANYVASYDAAAGNWAVIGANGMTGAVYALAKSPGGDLFAGGNFLNASANADADYVAVMRAGTTAWDNIGAGASTITSVWALEWTGGYLYIGGDFSQLFGTTVDFFAVSTGDNGVVEVGGGLARTAGGGEVRTIRRGPDNLIYVGGAFDVIGGGLAINDGWATYSGGLSGGWLPVQSVDLPGTPFVYATAAAPDGTLYAGHSGSGTATTSVTTTVTNSGTARSYPVIRIAGPSSGTAQLHSIGNVTTGKAIYFDNLLIAAGETATLDTTPDNLSFGSTFRGNLMSFVAPGSDIATFFLQPGANVMSLMYTPAAGGSAAMWWSKRYLGADDLTQ